MSNSLQKLLFEKINETPNMMVGLNRNADLNEPMHICLDGQNTDKFWIFTFKDNRIADGGSSMANFSSADHKLFACFSGDLSEETDKSEVQKHFSPSIASWYPDGFLDPNLLVLRFDIANVEIWEKAPSAAARLKMAIGAKVKQEELGRHIVT